MIAYREPSSDEVARLKDHRLQRWSPTETSNDRRQLLPDKALQ